MRRYWRWGVAGVAGALIAYFTTNLAGESAGSATSGTVGKSSSLGNELTPAHARRPTRQPVAVRDPTSDDYNAVVLQRLTEMSVLDVFEAESRKERWANEFETAIDDYVSEAIGELFPDVSVNTECKTASCKVSYGIEGMEEVELTMFKEYVQAFVPIGTTMSPSLSTSDDGKPVFTTTALILPEMLDHDNYFEFIQMAHDFYAKKKENANQMIRTQRQKENEKE